MVRHFRNGRDRNNSMKHTAVAYSPLHTNTCATQSIWNRTNTEYREKNFVNNPRADETTRERIQTHSSLETGHDVDGESRIWRYIHPYRCNKHTAANEYQLVAAFEWDRMKTNMLLFQRINVSMGQVSRLHICYVTESDSRRKSSRKYGSIFVFLLYVPLSVALVVFNGCFEVNQVSWRWHWIQNYFFW